MSDFTSFQLAALFLTLVLVEGRMVTRREEKEDRVVVGQAGKLMIEVEVEGEKEEGVNKRVVRQTEDEDGSEAGPFDLFGQVLNSFGKNENCGLVREMCHTVLAPVSFQGDFLVSWLQWEGNSSVTRFCSNSCVCKYAATFYC